MKTLAQMVLALTMVGCTTVNQEPLAVRQMSIEEVMEDTVQAAALTDKLQVVTYREYRVSARRIAQKSLDCWIIHKTIWRFDRLAQESDVEICHK